MGSIATTSHAPTFGSTSTTTSSAAAPCEVGSVVWNAVADGHSCGARIQWVMQNVHIGNLSASKDFVASEYPAVCGACAGGPSRKSHSESDGRLRGSTVHAR